MTNEKVREKSLEYLANSDYNNAFLEMKSLADLPNPSLEDVYLAAEFAFEAQNFEEAMKHLNQSVQLSENENESYFSDCIFMLRSYLFYTQKQLIWLKKIVKKFP